MIPIVLRLLPNSPSSFRGRHMPIRSFATRSLLILNALLAFTHSMMAEERPAIPSEERVVSFPAAADVNQLYVAIMGEVDTPGTYWINSTGLTMHRMIESARGFTRDASMAVRIIRSGRFRQTEIFSAKNDSRLMPGDLLIVETTQMTTTKGTPRYADSRRSQTIHADYQRGTPRVGIQIALINVVDYPLVLRLRPEQANASQLIQSLGQPMSLLARARIITPDVPGRMTSDLAKQAPRLENGSVLVFEPGAVNRDRIPVTLPRPFHHHSSASMRSGMSHWYQDQAADDHRSGQHPFWSNTNPFDTTSQTVFLNSRSSFDSRPVRLDYEPPSDIDQQIMIDDSKPSLVQAEGDAEGDALVVLNAPIPADVSPFEASDSLSIDSTSIGERSQSTADNQPTLIHLAILWLVVSTLVGAAMGLRIILSASLVEADRNSEPELRLTGDPHGTSTNSARMAGTIAWLKRLTAERPANHVEQIEFSTEFDFQGKVTKSTELDRPLLSVIPKPEESTVPLDFKTDQKELQGTLTMADQPITIPFRQSVPPFFLAGNQSVNSVVNPVKMSDPIKSGVEATEVENTASTPRLTPLAQALRQLQQERRI